MLVATTAIAVGLAALAAKSSWLSYMALMLLTITYTSLGVIAAVLSRGRLRVFCMGAAVPIAASAVVAGLIFINTFLGWAAVLDRFSEPVDENDSNILRWGLSAIWCFAPFNGLLCVFVHWLVWPVPSAAPENQNSK